MSYCCPADPEKKKEWEDKMLQEIDFLDNDIKKASEIFSALLIIRSFKEKYRRNENGR